MAAQLARFLKMASPAILILTAACGSADSSEVDVVTIGHPGDPFEDGVRLSLAGQLVRSSVAEGLVAFDDQGRIIPALADRWIVTDDGKSYIFRLRDGTWRDGSEITAKSATRALRRSIRALRGTALALDLGGIDEIREMAGRVVEIRLTHPMPHFLQLLAQPELGLVKSNEGAGPMRLEREADVAVLTPIAPEELGLPAVEKWEDRIRSVRLSAVAGEEAVERFNTGAADLVLGGRISDFPRTASVGILRGTIQLDPVEGLFGLHVVATKGFLGEAANREALAMAVDRDALIAPFGVDGWRATTGLVPESIEGDIDPRGERWGDLTFEARRAEAAAQVARWLVDSSEEGVNPKDRIIRVSIWLPQGPGSDMIFERLVQDFAAIGVTATRAADDESGDLRLMDVVSRYPRATWFLNRFHCKIEKGACEPLADEKLEEARAIEDPVERAALVAEAERLLTDANVFIPFGSPIRWALVRGDVTGFSTNSWGWHPLMPMALMAR